MKILIVFGTRPEAIKLFPVIHALQADAFFEPVVCVTGQHRQMLDQVLEFAHIEPDYDLDLMRPDQTLTDMTARIIGRVGEVIDSCQPDRVMVQGDTTTAMASALAAFYRKIPVDHVEAGLRSGDLYAPWPEELNRKVVGAIAALHFAPTKCAADALLRENLPRESIHITGNTVIDALLATKASVDVHGWVRNAIDLPGQKADDSRRIILVTTHRRENFDGGIDNIISALSELAHRADCRIAFPVHPNPNVLGPVRKALAGRDNVELLPPLDYLPLVHLLSRSDFVLTDSGGLQEEAPALGKPVLVMRDTTERPEGIDAGTALLVGTDPQRILREATRLLEDRTHYERMSRAHNPFGDGKAALKIRDILRAEAQPAATTRLESLRHAS
jgi:UDP-N-acetylglucosamine 2-epimerase (non-hydrolysing)